MKHNHPNGNLTITETSTKTGSYITTLNTRWFASALVIPTTCFRTVASDAGVTSTIASTLHRSSPREVRMGPRSATKRSSKMV